MVRAMHPWLSTTSTGAATQQTHGHHLCQLGSSLPPLMSEFLSLPLPLEGQFEGRPEGEFWSAHQPFGEPGRIVMGRISQSQSRESWKHLAVRQDFFQFFGTCHARCRSCCHYLTVMMKWWGQWHQVFWTQLYPNTSYFNIRLRIFYSPRKAWTFYTSWRFLTWH